VIAAAGSGQRLGAGGPKAFAELAGRPLLAHAVAAAAGAAAVERIVVAAPPGFEDEARAVLSAVAAPEPLCLAGGETRADSVRAALEAVEGELVLIHDAARPLAPPSLFDAVAARLEADPGLEGAIAAAPIADTVKRSRSPHGGAGDRADAEVETTVPRAALWCAQTPQGFRADALRAAQAAAAAAGTIGEATEEAGLIELNGGRVALVLNPAPNLKVTTREDLRVVETLLGRSGRV
jgi:2-C-methyl-D-erythritol 4-phosphate cytidylyltransferase